MTMYFVGTLIILLPLLFIAWLLFSKVKSKPESLLRLILVGSVVLIVAGLGYLMDVIGKILLSNYDLTIAMFTFIGELLIIFWLLIKWGRIQKLNLKAQNIKSELQVDGKIVSS